MKVVARFAAAAMALSTGAVAAATYVATVDASAPPEVFFNTATVLVSRGSFEDIVNISWSAPPMGGFASASVTAPPSSARNISWSSVQLFDGLNGTGALLATATSPQLFFSDVTVTDTDFSVKLIGTGTGTAGGQYILTGSVLPVPEPETYAMMLAGVVAVGFMAARRRRRN